MAIPYLKVYLLLLLYLRSRITGGAVRQASLNLEPESSHTSYMALYDLFAFFVCFWLVVFHEAVVSR